LPAMSGFGVVAIFIFIQLWALFCLFSAIY